MPSGPATQPFGWASWTWLRQPAAVTLGLGGFAQESAVNWVQVVAGRSSQRAAASTRLSVTPSASRSEWRRLAEPGSAYVAEATERLAHGYLDLADLGEFEVKGASQPVDVFELRGVSARRGRGSISRGSVGSRDSSGVRARWRSSSKR